MHGMEHAWWRACMAGVCMVGDMHGRGHAWQGCACVACMVGGMHGRGHV